MTIEAGRTYTVKEWFANKIANEVGRNITICELFAVIKETEKAVYSMVCIGGERRKTTWIPKSVLIDTSDDEIDELDGRFPLIVNDNYEEVVAEFNNYWKMFK